MSVLLDQQQRRRKRWDKLKCTELDTTERLSTAHSTSEMGSRLETNRTGFQQQPPHAQTVTDILWTSACPPGTQGLASSALRVSFMRNENTLCRHQINGTSCHLSPFPGERRRQRKPTLRPRGRHGEWGFPTNKARHFPVPRSGRPPSSTKRSAISYQRPVKPCRGDFPGGSEDEDPPANAGDTDSIPDPGRSHVLRSNWAQAL